MLLAFHRPERWVYLLLHGTQIHNGLLYFFFSNFTPQVRAFGDFFIIFLFGSLLHRLVSFQQTCWFAITPAKRVEMEGRKKWANGIKPDFGQLEQKNYGTKFPIKTTANYLEKLLNASHICPGWLQFWGVVVVLFSFFFQSIQSTIIARYGCDAGTEPCDSVDACGRKY